jgi:hypothetical protein
MVAAGAFLGLRTDVHFAHGEAGVGARVALAAGLDEVVLVDGTSDRPAT